MCVRAWGNLKMTSKDLERHMSAQARPANKPRQMLVRMALGECDSTNKAARSFLDLI